MSSSHRPVPLAGRPRARLACAAVVLLLSAFPACVQAQFLKRLKKAATEAATHEMSNQVQRMVANSIKCVFDDPLCVQAARKQGQDVVLTDDEGNVLLDDDSQPVTDPEVAAKQVVPAGPGEGVWANYDFVPGDRVLVDDDFSGDAVGDFPRRLRLVRGNWELVRWDGRLLLRNTGPRGSAFEVPLGDSLPDRFTIEFDAYLTHQNQRLVVTTAAPPDGGRWDKVPGTAFQVGVAKGGSGVRASGRGGVEALTVSPSVGRQLVPIRIMVDGRYAKVYVGARRVANVPNATVLHGTALHIENIYFADEAHPIYLGPIRVAAGGRDLYAALADSGRVATHGVLFAVNSDRIRGESTPTLAAIAAMLRDHPTLRLSIEGHTDSTGAADYNQALSERRAAAVRQYLVAHEGIAAERLRTAGFGETRPVTSNASPEGRRQNRRVELVRLPGPGDADPGRD